ncbi:hypothetical protein BDY21DRAFT_290766 [Lineolata rhizophorae]|uniref:RWD domain-containing protein n=1 Tax=Lineolata rhizophorae TaxID=578093 RepID=A0A6A6NT96_9PEZI|nr:hypothetical protein BDY21DRAFT_290766 [Lineolata rhizophorae]
MRLPADAFERRPTKAPASVFQSPTFDRDVSIRVNEAIGSASISPSGRDVVLASRHGLYIIDLDSPYSPPRHLPHRSPWEVADVQWSPHASTPSWIVSTSNQKALVWNVERADAPIHAVLHAHSRAITDINFSAHHPFELATCAVDSFVHCWDIRVPRPVLSFADWFAGATQVKWNRQDEHIIASSHDRVLRIWDTRKGAFPLRSIDAHSTKIYGVDWNRTDSRMVLTCSLDKTIKFWNYHDPDNRPERVIRTPFPVWRARHTPFGHGVLAMPQRGNYDLHLYDRRLEPGQAADAMVRPVHSFDAHKDQVKEFLWRSRGDIEGGNDNREFQLVSWGMDRDLHLHHIDPNILSAVGHERGKESLKGLNLTRKGAQYRTYRDEQANVSYGRQPVSQVPGLTAMFHAASTSVMAGRSPLPAVVSWNDGSYVASSPGMQTRSSSKKPLNPITWMKGVKIGKRDSDALGTIGSRSSMLLTDQSMVWENPDSLGDEITSVGERFKKVNFEEVDVDRRSITVTLNGPWGHENKPVFIRIELIFPDDYPRSAAPIHKIQKTTSAISDETLVKLDSEIRSITDMYRLRHRGCLEAIVSYLLGERDLHDSISWLSEEAGLGDETDDKGAESSSDEEDGVGADFDGGQTQDLEMSGRDMLRTVNANAQVPLPRECGATWANDGTLVCFFPPKPEPKPLFSLSAIKNSERFSNNQRIFPGAGRYGTDSPSRSNNPTLDVEEDDMEGSSEGSWTSSSSGSSSEDIGGLPGPFQPPTAWRGAAFRLQRSSQHSSADQGHRTTASKPKSVVSLRNMEHILPAKKTLAQNYQILGDGPSVCSHNEMIAREHGYEDLAEIWNFIRLILCNEVPLQVLEQSKSNDQILVLARRSLVSINRKDSGADLSFDHQMAVKDPKFKGRVKWGHHPFAGSWLVPALFDYFEARADVQMLAMLSCMLAEPPGRDKNPEMMMHFRQSEIPLALKAPAFSLDYYPSTEVAWGFVRGAPPGSAPPGGWDRRSLGSSPGWDSFTTNASKRLEAHGSASSFNGPWIGESPSGEPFPSNPLGTTPPTLSRTNTHRSSAAVSFSSSPEQHHHGRKPTNISSAWASLRQIPLGVSPSPPHNSKPRTSEGDLSTSAPTSGITWGSTTVYDGSTNAPQPHRSKHARRGYNYAHDTDLRDIEIKTNLRNQDQFDDEAGVDVPLLDPMQEGRYKAYREAYASLLSVWGFTIQRSEVLKFNGLVSHAYDVRPIDLAIDIASRESSQTHDIAAQELQPWRSISKAYANRVPSPGTHGDDQVLVGRKDQSDPLPPPELVVDVIERDSRPSCIMCWQRITGLYKSCLACGHITHTKCCQQWVAANDTGTCKTGCGCFCPADP